jgi:hypothetical protein
MTTHPRTPSRRGPEPRLLPTHNRLSKPAAFIDVFVDDFIAVAQKAACARCASALMHAIDEVLKAPTSSADKFKEPLSLSKLVKDGSWTSPSPSGLARGRRPQDHRAATPPERATPGCLQEPQGKQQVSKKSWQSLLGERFASIGIPGSRGLFCILQLALSKSDRGRVRVTPAVKSHLESFERLVRPDRTPDPLG